MRLIENLNDAHEDETAIRCKICRRILAYEDSDVYVRRVVGKPVPKTYYLNCPFCKETFQLEV